jgi:hypothetical protein
MADKLDIACPNCGKGMKVPSEVVGKVIRCKSCAHTFPVTASASAKRAAPAKGKPAAPPAPVADDPIKFADDPKPPPPPEPKPKSPFADDDDEDENPYGVTPDDLDVPRCPFCATELDPPDTKVCLNCGYNLLERKRHASKKVWELTTGDYFKHWLPGIAWIVALLTFFSLAIYSSLSMRDWLTGSFLEKDDKNPITLLPEFYLPPFAFNLCTWVCFGFVFAAGAKFIWARLVKNWRPPETVKKS